MRSTSTWTCKITGNRSVVLVMVVAWLLVAGSGCVGAGALTGEIQDEEVVRVIHPARALWLWDSRPVVTDPIEKRRFFTFIEAPKEEGTPPIRRLFISAGWAINPIATPFEKRSMREFLTEAHQRGIEVDILAGDPSWARPDKYDSVQSLLERIALWQREARDDDPQGMSAFDGVQLDVEPYLLPEWPSQVLFDSFVGMASMVRDFLDEHADLRLEFGLAIPTWLDKEEYHFLNEDLQAVSDYVAIMDYRDTADRIIRDAVGELEAGDRLGKKVFVGVETRAPKGSDPPSVTFYDEGYRFMESELAKVVNTLADYASFAGIAIHDYKWYVDLKE